jgi:hypothetical protein
MLANQLSGLAGGNACPTNLTKHHTPSQRFCGRRFRLSTRTADLSLYAPMTKCSTEKVIQAIAAEAGMVKTQAQTIFVAMPQRTAFIR